MLVKNKEPLFGQEVSGSLASPGRDVPHKMKKYEVLEVFPITIQDNEICKQIIYVEKLQLVICSFEFRHVSSD